MFVANTTGLPYGEVPKHLGLRYAQTMRCKHQITCVLSVFLLMGCSEDAPRTPREPTQAELEKFAPETISDEKKEILREMAEKASQQQESERIRLEYNEESFDPTSRYEQVPRELSVSHFGNMKLFGEDFLIEKTLAEEELYSKYAISYLSNGLKISGVLHIPVGKGPFPLIVANHGYIAPSVYTRGRGLKREEDYFSKNGFAVLHSDYRGHAASDPSPDTRKAYDAGLEYSMDVINGIKALKKANIPEIDTNRIGMLGHSMGGGIALNIAVAYPELVRAFVLYAPVSGDAWRNFERWRSERDDDDRTIEVLGSSSDNPNAWLKLSSATRLSEVLSPVLIVHGDKDNDVPVEWSRELYAALTQLRKDADYIELEGEKHEFIPQWDAFIEASTDFFKSHL